MLHATEKFEERESEKKTERTVPEQDTEVNL